VFVTMIARSKIFVFPIGKRKVNYPPYLIEAPRIQVGWPAWAPTGLCLWQQLQVQGRQIVALQQCRNFDLLGLADDLSVGRDDATDGGI